MAKIIFRYRPLLNLVSWPVFIRFDRGKNARENFIEILTLNDINSVTDWKSFSSDIFVNSLEFFVFLGWGRGWFGMTTPTSKMKKKSSHLFVFTHFSVP